MISKQKQIILDYTYMLKKHVGSSGVDEKDVIKLASKTKLVHSRTHKMLKTGKGSAFVRELSNNASVYSIKKQAEFVRKHFESLIVIGIGGSDLGARVLQQAFKRSGNGVDVYFLGDTTDPSEIEKILSEVNLKRTAINIVSKSGNTVEPLATFLYVRKKLITEVGKKEHAEHIFVTTDPSESILNKMVELHGYHWLHHPHDIGGRWAVLTVVGLFSAACSGIDIRELVKGAKDYYERSKAKPRNASMIYAALHHLAFKQGKNISVLMPYSSQLSTLGDWYSQLWAESLGKEGKGMTPVSALGPKDQHSQVQLYNQGPDDKIITFIKVNKIDHKAVVPKHLEGEEEIKFLDGKKLDDILNIEQQATSLALKKHKRPNATITIDEVSENQVGQLLMFFMLACVYSAEFENINAFDQPGVEEGKVNMYAMLGKKGYAKQKEKLKKDLSKISRKLVK